MKKLFLVSALLCSLLTLPILAQNITVSWVSPANMANIEKCGNVDLAVDATIDVGEIDKVEFYRNGSRIKNDTKAPYEFTVKNMPGGWHQFMAQVIAEDGSTDSTDIRWVNVGNTENGDRVINGEFNCSVTPWRLDNYEGAASTIELVPDLFLTDDSSGAYIEITEVGAQTWGVQLMQPFVLEKGHTYDVFFTAMADDPKAVQITFSQDYDPWASYWYTDIEVYDLDEYGPYTFECDVDDNDVMFKFVIGGNNIPLYLDAVKVIDAQWTDVKDDAISVVDGFELYQNYPNPFNPSTEIKYSIPQNGLVKLSIYNVMGELVNSFQGPKPAGTHSYTWNGLTQNGSTAPTGTYIYHLESNGMQMSRKMTLIK